MDVQSDLPEHVTANIGKIAEVRQGVEKRINRHQRAIESATAALGRPVTLYVLFTLGSTWILYNSEALVHHWAVIDAPPFFWLQGMTTLYAALVATMVLAAQKRQRLEWEQREHFELQVNLLAEQKVTKIIALLEELRRDLPMVSDRVDPVAVAMQEGIDPQAMMSVLETAIEGLTPETTPKPE